ncbi:hypothetical protein [Photobacterium sanguinicancri]|nr:hypothetical protein [Photobacterium sanguinicancri]
MKQTRMWSPLGKCRIGCAVLVQYLRYLRMPQWESQSVKIWRLGLSS